MMDNRVPTAKPELPAHMQRALELGGKPWPRDSAHPHRVYLNVRWLSRVGVEVEYDPADGGLVHATVDHWPLPLDIVAELLALDVYVARDGLTVGILEGDAGLVADRLVDRLVGILGLRPEPVYTKAMASLLANT